MRPDDRERGFESGGPPRERTMSGAALLWGLTALMALVAASAWWFWKHGAAFECVDSVVEEVASPDGKLVAARYERTCSSNIATHVALRARGEAFKPASDLDDVYVAMGRPRLLVEWREGGLRLTADAPSVIPERKRWRQIAVQVMDPATPPRPRPTRESAHRP